MKEANVTQNTECNKPVPILMDGFPSVIVPEDLVCEIGNQLVSGLNKTKLINSLLEKAKTTESALQEVSIRMGKLRLSNEQYVENNRKLNTEIVKLRKLLDGKSSIVPLKTKKA